MDRDHSIRTQGVESSPKNKSSLLNGKILRQALIGSFIKLNPITMMNNPVMFIVEIGTILTLLTVFMPELFGMEGHTGFNFAVFAILLFTILFANFAEALAEGRGKAQAESLKKTKTDTKARKLDDKGNIHIVSSTDLKKGDIVLVEAGDLVPSDGEIIEGLASIDESAITGESAPVIKEAGGDFRLCYRRDQCA